jgi:hypothetical protein
MWGSFAPSVTDFKPNQPRLIRGVNGSAFVNFYGDPYLAKLSDGYIYLFAAEVHERKTFGSSTADHHILPVWMRSKDGVYWSAPTPGPVVTAWGFAGVVESGGYLYWADMGQVYRRPIGPVNHEISNYVTDLQFNLPRDNQVGSGDCTVANPAGVNDNVLLFSDKEIKVEVGLKIADGSYQFQEFDKFWIKKTTRELQGKISRLKVEFGNMFSRLENPFRDVFNFVGNIDWNDWRDGARNKAFNYFFATDTHPSVSDNQLHTRGKVLYTGWKGQNCDVSAHFTGLPSTSG